jgi:hypothetical protein
MQKMTAIENFWTWFFENENQIYVNYEYKNIGDQLDYFLEKIHPNLSWEIGPCCDASVGSDLSFFAVSPNLDSDLIELAQEIIDCHPDFESAHWHFCVGRQRRPWSDVILFSSNQKNPVFEVDLSKWKHLVYKVPDSKLFDIVFECGENDRLTDNEIHEIGLIIAMSLLGEITLIEKIDQIEVVRSLNEDQIKGAKPAEWLPYAFGMKPL